MTGWIALLALAGLAAGAAWVRLAPVDPARWHADLGVPGPAPDRGVLVCLAPDRLAGDPARALARLDAIARATPRTERLAGSVGEGHVTWVTRSRLMGFPDFTTAQILPDRGLCLYARQRFGEYDWGVNAQRLEDWQAALMGAEGSG
ncbi:MAG: DUF1499 domain-containing protein [Tabrizicola sp.]